MSRYRIAIISAWFNVLSLLLMALFTTAFSWEKKSGGEIAGESETMDLYLENSFLVVVIPFTVFAILTLRLAKRKSDQVLNGAIVLNLIMAVYAIFHLL